LKSKWPDFLFTVAVRFVSGAVVGVLVSLPVIFFAGSRGRGRQKSLLVELTQAGNHRLIIGWFVVWGVLGGVIAALRTPVWETPWYEPEVRPRRANPLHKPAEPATGVDRDETVPPGE
jgi:hypothetical protein